MPLHLAEAPILADRHIFGMPAMRVCAWFPSPAPETSLLSELSAVVSSARNFLTVIVSIAIVLVRDDVAWKGRNMPFGGKATAAQ